MSAKRTAYGRVKFNDFGDGLDRPHFVRALESFQVNLLDGDGFNYLEGQYMRVDAGSEWLIYGPGSLCDVRLEGDGAYLELNYDDLRKFEMVEEGGYCEDILY